MLNAVDVIKNQNKTRRPAMNICEWIFSFILGVVASFIGVYVSIEYGKMIQNRKDKENQNIQWESLKKMMYDVRDWARTLETCLRKEVDSRSVSFVSAMALYNKLACNEIPKQYRNDVFEMAILIEEVQNGLLKSDKSKDYIDCVSLIGDIACKLARDNNPDFLKGSKEVKQIVKNSKK